MTNFFRRRALIAAAIALATPVVRAKAPAGKSWVLGVIYPNTEAILDPDSVFRTALRQHGYVEGHNLRIEMRAAAAHFERLPALASELAQMRVDAIVCVGTPATQAAQRATTSIPIIGVSIANPVKLGIAKSLARPGLNITGVSNESTDTNGKRLELLLAFAPKIRRIAHVINPDNPGNILGATSRKAATDALNLEYLEFPIRGPADLQVQFAAMTNARVDGISVSIDSVLGAHAREIAGFALARRLPSVSGIPNFVRDGGLASYAPSSREQWILAAYQVDRILNGAKPGDLAFTTPTLYDLAINRSTAKVLGITIPQALLARADLVVD